MKDPILARFESVERFIVAVCVVLFIAVVAAQLVMWLWRIAC